MMNGWYLAVFDCHIVGAPPKTCKLWCCTVQDSPCSVQCTVYSVANILYSSVSKWRGGRSDPVLSWLTAARSSESAFTGPHTDVRDTTVYILSSPVIPVFTNISTLQQPASLGLWLLHSLSLTTVESSWVVVGVLCGVRRWWEEIINLTIGEANMTFGLSGVESEAGSQSSLTSPHRRNIFTITA